MNVASGLLNLGLINLLSKGERRKISRMTKAKSPINPNKTEAEWRAELDPLAYHVTRESGTERAYSHTGFPKEPGVFSCLCCGVDLFSQAGKFESGCGWPAFSAPLKDAPLEHIRDVTHGMIRTEVRCENCDAHLGHVFDDGPAPTGQRYCINGVAITFSPSRNTVKTDR